MSKIDTTAAMKWAVVACLLIAVVSIASSQHFQNLQYEEDVRTEIMEVHSGLRATAHSHDGAGISEHLQTAIQAAERVGDRDIFFLAMKSGAPSIGNISSLKGVESWQSLSVQGNAFLTKQFDQGSAIHDIVGFGQTLENGDYLFVGYDIDEHRRNTLLLNLSMWVGFLTFLAALYFALIHHKQTGEIQIKRMSALLAAHGLHAPVRSKSDFASLVESANKLVEKLKKEKQTAADAGTIAAHDLRAPLSRLQMELVELGQQTSLPKNLNGRLSSIVDGVENLINRFDQAVTLSKTSRRKVSSKPPVVNAAKVLQDVVDLYEPWANDNGQTISFDAPKEVRVAVDESDLQRMFGNIVENACRHNSNGTNISLTYSATDAGARFEIADDGVGVSDDIMQKIQFDGSRGAGFGIETVLLLAGLYNIQLEFSNRAPGFAVVFCIPYAD